MSGLLNAHPIHPHQILAVRNVALASEEKNTRIGKKGMYLYLYCTPDVGDNDGLWEATE